MKVSITGTKELVNKLAKLENLDLTSAFNKAAILVENAAKIKCPVGDTGVLRSSITHEVDNEKAVIGTNVEYAPYVEIGTGIFSSMGNGRQDRWSYQTPDGKWHSTIGQHPQPYLQPALDENEAEIRRIIKEQLSKEIQEIARR